jgi:glycerol-1-phosphate dehydrogenase [NAD(P)+]
MNCFDLLKNTLLNENINLNSESNVPNQVYSKNYFEFENKMEEILSHFFSNNLKDDSVFILCDGNFKSSELNSNISISDVVIKIISKKYNVIYKNLSLESKTDVDNIHASEYFLNHVNHLIKNEKRCKVYIALGSGTITDLLKHSLYLNAPDSIFISIPTAMTVTAFTSSFSVLDIEGAKRTRISKTIHTTIWIEPLLQAAPITLSRAGYGDLLARFVAYGDWYLAYKLKITETYNELAYRLMEVFSEPLKNLSESIGQNILTNDATQIHASALAMAGIAMSLSGETTPLSGYEHVISHALDFLRLTSNRTLVLHGEQVALASLTSAMSIDWFLENTEFDIKKFRSMNEKETEKLINQFLNSAPYYGNQNNINTIDQSKLLEVKKLFIQDYMIKSEKWNKARENFDSFLNELPQIKKHLSNITIRSYEMQKLLENAKLPTYPEITNPPTSALEFRWALRFSPFIRSRFCIADLIFWIGEDTCVVAAI